MNTAIASAAVLALCVGADPGADEAKSPFAGVRVDEQAGWVEFDGFVPISAHDPEAPNVFLELIVCTTGTKEHEALVVTDVRPSHIHAALLLLDLEPGRPGRWTWEGDNLVAHDPEGPLVRIDLIHAGPDGETVRSHPSEWVRHLETEAALPRKNWVFCGSQFIDRGYGERYDADGTGVVIGLTTFGSEVVAWPRTFSPDSAIEEPVWVANPEKTPAYETPVTVRITKVGD